MICIQHLIPLPSKICEENEENPRALLTAPPSQNNTARLKGSDFIL